MQVGAIVTSHVQVIGPDETVQEAARKPLPAGAAPSAIAEPGGPHSRAGIAAFVETEAPPTE